MMHTAQHATGSTAARRGFTLIELLVSLAVLIIALTVATTVFGITSKVSRQTAAANEMNSILDSFLREVELDLNEIDTTRSVMAIYGRTQAAALTEDLRQAQRYYRVLVGDPNYPQLNMYNPGNPGDPNLAAPTGSSGNYSNPRADILMFITQRADASHSPPSIDPASVYQTNASDVFQLALEQGAKVAPNRIMIGHASVATGLGAAGSGGSLQRIRMIENVRTPANPSKDPTLLSCLPANQWQLVRQAALIEPIPVAQPTNPSPDLGFSNDTFTRLLTGTPLANDNSKPYAHMRAGDSAPLALNEYLAAFQPYGNQTIATARPYEFDATLPSVQPLQSTPRWIDYSYPYGTNSVRGPKYQDLIKGVMFANADLDGDGQNESAWHNFADVVENTPIGWSSNQGMQRLSGCVWFQVEILIPEDPRNSPAGSSVLPSTLDNAANGPFYQRDDMPRWVQIPDGTTYAFVPDSSENRRLIENLPAGPYRRGDFAATYDQLGQQKQIIRTWPYAIRITVRAYDGRGQLDQPLVRTLVHRFP